MEKYYIFQYVKLEYFKKHTLSSKRKSMKINTLFKMNYSSLRA